MLLMATRNQPVEMEKYPINSKRVFLYIRKVVQDVWTINSMIYIYSLKDMRDIVLPWKLHNLTW